MSKKPQHRCSRRARNKAHQVYVWAYVSKRVDPLQAVIYEFAPSRSGKHARAFLRGWQGKLVCNDFAGYNAGFEQGMTEIACWAHYHESRFIWSNRAQWL